MDNDKTQFSLDHVEAALCAWEWMIEHHLRNNSNSGLDAVGTATLRLWCAELGPYIDEVYKLMDYDIRSDVPFDWEIVPRIMERIEFIGGNREHQYITPSARSMATMVEGDLTSEVTR